MSNIKLTKKIVYTGTITLKTGLHIGGTNAALNIGGPDKFVVRNPINNIPYIPGSSLKGKMRALIEVLHRCVDTDKKGGIWASKDPDSISGSLFGVAADAKESKGNDNYENENQEQNKNIKRYASRLIVRDAELIFKRENGTWSCGDDFIKVMTENKIEIRELDFSKTDLPFTESKTEVAIDRVTAKANPRTFERVPAGAQFQLNIVLNIFENDDESRLKHTLQQAIRLLEDDYLGGHGSRGYGQVEIKYVEEKPKTY